MTAQVTPKPNGTKTKLQVKAIWSLARGKAMTDEQLHDLVAATCDGNDSIRALSKADADKVIEALGGKPFFKRGAKRTRQDHHQQTGTKQVVSGTQLDLMNSLAKRRSWTEESLKKFCQRMIHRDAPATTKQANTIIEALKKMNQRENL